MEFTTVVKDRRSVRKYSNVSPDWRKIIRAIDLSRYAPSAGNITFLNYILVNEPEKINKIGTACQQNFISKAKYIVVVVGEHSKLKSNYGERAETYSVLGAGASIENFLLSLTNFGLVSCWVGLFNEEIVKEILDIPEKLKVEGIFPVGLELKNNETPERNKAPLDGVLFFNGYNKKTMTPKKRVKSQNS